LAALAFFHYILIGHVHAPVDHFGGRLKLIGSVFPTAFDNLESKRALLYDTEVGVFGEVCTWDASTHLFRGLASQVSTSAEYFDLEDDLPPGQAQKLAVQLFKQGALGVRLKRSGLLEDLTKPEVTATQFENLATTIENELAANRPELLPLWKELRELQ
jgi:hypothetical protein